LQLLEEMIVLRRAEELDLHVSSEELEEAVGRIEGDYGEEGFKAMFMKQAVSLETWKERLKRQLLIEKVTRKELLRKISVTPEEIKDYYEQHREEWAHGKQIRVHHILLPDKDKADLVLEQLKKGEDFSTLARVHSIAPESEQGGDMGYVARGQLPKCLEDPLFRLKKDTVSPVIKTPYGYHIFKVIEEKDAGEPKIEDWIEKIKARIQQEKLEAAYGPWLAKLRSRYRITVNKEMI
jgi:parvulin-like peptidyl-prolyl isomerase